MDRNALWLFGSIALVLAGFAWGRRAGRARATAGRRGRPWLLWLLYGLIGFSVVDILLAKLFDSAVLGWLFGLSLLFDVLLVPCVALMAIGYGAGRWSTRGAVPPPIDDEVEPLLRIRLDRDTVHASDDGDTRTITADRRSTLSTLLRQLLAGAYLPTVQGEATWVVTTSAHGERPVAVAAQPWTDARLAVADESLDAHFRGVAPGIRFASLGRRPPGSLVGLP